MVKLLLDDDKLLLKKRWFINQDVRNGGSLDFQGTVPTSIFDVSKNRGVSRSQLLSWET